MAPEVILGKPYDGRCDWWSIGIVLFECLYGRTPFYCENRQQTKEKIVQHRSTLEFPSHERWARPTCESRRRLAAPSDTVVDLLKAILTDKETRLSSSRYRHGERAFGRRLSAATNNGFVRHVCANGAEEIKAHKFFQGIVWSQLHLSQPPFVPRVKENQSITKYFEDEKEIISDDSSSYHSIKERIDENADDEQLRATLGRHFDRWKSKSACQLSLRQRDRGRVHELFTAPALATRRRWDKQTQADNVLDDCESKSLRPKKVKKRPRDKLLRDPVVARKVMDLRKKNAFFGYTYRRPKPVVLEPGKKMRRNVLTRPSILPVGEF